jgi:hypothetical protein
VSPRFSYQFPWFPTGSHWFPPLQLRRFASSAAGVDPTAVRSSSAEPSEDKVWEKMRRDLRNGAMEHGEYHDKQVVFLLMEYHLLVV